MDIQDKSNEELNKELLELKKEYSSLKLLYEEVVNERKQVEDSLLKIEARIVSAIKTAGLFLYEEEGETNLNRKMSFLETYTSMRALLGIPQEQEHRARDYWIEHIEPEDMQNIMLPAIQKFEHEGHDIVSAEYRYLNEKQELIWFRHTAHALHRNQEGEVLRLVGAVQDITESKRSEEKILEMLEFEKLISEIASSFVKINPEQLKQNIINAQCLICEFLDLDLSSIYQPISETGNKLKLSYLYHRAENFELPDLLIASEYFPWCEKELLSGKIPVVNSMNDLPPEASRDHESWNYFGIKSSVMLPMIAANEEFLGTISFDAMRAERSFSEEIINWLKLIATLFANIIMRSRTEDRLINAKIKAEESDRLKSAFLANMSHEIRTPMNGILGFAELLKVPGLTGEQQQEYIKIIEKSGARMLNIINDIVDISKIEANLMNVNIKDTNINEKIEFIYTFFTPQAEEKGIKFRFKNTLTALESIIKTDSEKVYSVLMNLVKNAIKYTEKGEIELGCLKKGNNLEFYVKDTGIGIPKNRQEAIFERFIQADIADKMARQGAGLGLSIAKAYVEMLGGKIWLESEECIGSTFYFTLPYNTEPKVKNVIGNIVPSQEQKIQIRNLKILIAEDDETSEMLISKTVKEFSNEVIEARTGIEAVEICRTNPDLDLILMDIQMPLMNGHEATRQIRQFNKHVVIIAQTAFGLSGDREKAIEVGCNDYIAKPIKKEELLSLIQKYFKR